MNLIGPLKVTFRGNQFILTMTCYFSKVEAFPLKDKTALSVAQAIHSAYCRHGAPCEIISDQGENSLIRLVYLFVNFILTYLFP